MGSFLCGLKRGFEAGHLEAAWDWAELLIATYPLLPLAPCILARSINICTWSFCG
jgi:hypothetical protein